MFPDDPTWGDWEGYPSYGRKGGPKQATLPAGTELARVKGRAQQLLKAERVALNFLQRLSGIATLTRRFVDEATKGNPQVMVVDTRKTTPGLRYLEKYAVRAGGGRNRAGRLPRPGGAAGGERREDHSDPPTTDSADPHPAPPVRAHRLDARAGALPRRIRSRDCRPRLERLHKVPTPIGIPGIHSGRLRRRSPAGGPSFPRSPRRPRGPALAAGRFLG